MLPKHSGPEGREKLSAKLLLPLGCPGRRYHQELWNVALFAGCRASFYLLDSIIIARNIGMNAQGPTPDN
jgi:hypothetical protein